MIGKSISHYRIIEKLGEGGMGLVYKADDTKLNRVVALKFISPQTLDKGDEKSRLIREAQAAASLDHPNICTIHGLDEAEGQTFIAMTWVDGQTLKDKIEAAPVGLDAAVRIAIQVASGLQAAHERGIIHRDIKSANIMLTKDDQVKIMDFGVAKVRDAESITRTGVAVGTVAYMSPEQALGKKVDQRTDIWALGVVLHEMVTGQLPFKSDYPEAAVYSIVHTDAEPLTALRTGVPMELDRIVRKAMAKDPAERYQHADDVLADLTALQRNLESGSTATYAPPRPPRARVLRYAALGIVVIALAILARWYFASDSVIDSVAVLPLGNLSGDPAQEFFADGMTEALIAELANVSGLKVISRTSVMQFKGTDLSLPDIANALNVDAIVEGTVLLVGDRVRITAQLINARTDAHLWAESYERDFGDILALQSEIAQNIARRVQVTITPDEQARMVVTRSVNRESYEAYLMGRFHWNKRTAAGFKAGLEFFKRAVELDSTYAPAYAGLADLYVTMGSYGVLPPNEAYPLSRKAALRAIALDENNAEAHASLGGALVGEGRWLDAENAFVLAIRLKPGYAPAHQWYAEELTMLGRSDAAIEQIKRAKDLDPLSLIVNATVGWVLFYARHYDEAIEQSRQTLQFDPDFPPAHSILGRSFEQVGSYDKAIQAFQRGIDAFGPTPSGLAALGRSYALAGELDKAKAIEDSLLASSDFVSPYSMGLFYVALGDGERALTSLERAYHEDHASMGLIAVDPRLDPLHAEPRFIALVDQMGFNRLK